ncbi:ketol-acid reductoisomerase [Microlunatus speluncae]|uniref:ketol-acid reductoisomerase n=1 Tax=Microlunatus speluncae TaxID=2594267 RepID=UPI0012665855|nr:ketol-acid reductoisomerase [Microlunatus speluncae]
MSTYSSAVFPTETITLPAGPETIVRGGRQLFPLLDRGFAGVRRIGVLGWGPQGRAQALNLRDSLAGTKITVSVGLRPGSASAAAARAEGFTEEAGTLGDWLDVAAASDLLLILISDAALAEHYPEIFAAVRQGATIGLSHGFLIGHLAEVGDQLPQGVGVIAVCPKGMGDSVRRLYLQGAEVNGAGINASFAVEVDHDGHGVDRALAWSIALGAPYTFPTDLRSEYLSDIVGERGILLGAVHGIVEALFRRFRAAGDDPERAYLRSCENITGPIAAAISDRGLRLLRDDLAGPDRAIFDQAYAACYPVATELITEIYDEVEAGTELRSVILAGHRLRRTPMSEINRSPMWAVAKEIREGRPGRTVPIDPYTAGVFVATMIAQVDLFAGKGHAWSEIINESIIEAVDSLLPYLHARDVGYMIDNCSTTARLGARRWGPRFQAVLEQIVFPATDEADIPDPELVKNFDTNPAHDALAVIAELRPSVKIAL